ncbi:unnamed protein product [Auanema sp. JU1783]|nr:unnamed protein product [Auanema sp. JU1783]
MRWFITISIFLLCTSCEAQRVKRQFSIDDLISRALNLVRPIFDTSQPLQNDEMLRKPLDPSQRDMRENAILGARRSSLLDDLPLCKGDNRICQFISCSAENFKKDPAFGNIQLGVQVLGDAKLRKAISSNPEAITAVCKEQGMDESQCKLFSKGFQLIDRFITTIEKPAGHGVKTVQADPVPIPIQKDPEPMNDEPDYDALTSSATASSTSGSKTWGTGQNKEPQLMELQNDLVASLTPPPMWGLAPIAPFTPPAPPTAPPLAFPTVPSFILQPLHNLEKYFSPDKYLLGSDQNKAPETNSITRFKRESEDFYDDDVNNEAQIRQKRDYYDELTNTGRNTEVKESSGNNPSAKRAPINGQGEDYYGGVEEEEHVQTTARPESGLRNCVNILGIN